MGDTAAHHPLGQVPVGSGVAAQDFPAAQQGRVAAALRRDLHYANLGSVRGHRLEQQTEQAWCLTVLTNAVVTWSTEYYAMAVAELRAAGRDIPNKLLAHISPAHSENVNFFGTITVDIEAELAKLDERGPRPLRLVDIPQL